MPITILDYVISVTGSKDLYLVEDCQAAGVDIFGRCQRCGVTIAVHNAYPSATGCWRCAGCIGDTGFATVADFTARTDTTVTCPSCGSTDVSETPATASESRDDYALECGNCGQVWQP